MLHPPNVIFDLFGLPKFLVPVYSWFINIVVVIIFSIGFDFIQVVVVYLPLFSAVLAHDVQFGGIVANAFLFKTSKYTITLVIWQS